VNIENLEKKYNSEVIEIKERNLVMNEKLAEDGEENLEGD
jgi:hypothetical protein